MTVEFTDTQLKAIRESAKDLTSYTDELIENTIEWFCTTFSVGDDFIKDTVKDYRLRILLKIAKKPYAKYFVKPSDELIVACAFILDSELNEFLPEKKDSFFLKAEKK